MADGSKMTSPIAPHDIRVVAFARYPVAGLCKTRLIPAVGPDGAARIHKRLVEICVQSVRESGLRLELRITGAPPSDFADWLGSDIDYVDQGEGDLGDRLLRATEPLPVLLIGSDAPGLGPAQLRAAAGALAAADVVIGPADDGGYYLLGLTSPAPWLFNDMAWGTDGVFASTCARLRERNIVPAVLDSLSDVDRPEDLARWPELMR